LGIGDWAQTPNPKTPNPKPQTPNPKKKKYLHKNLNNYKIFYFLIY